MVHTTVLLHESVDGLNLKQGSVFVDATLNAGGHSKLVLNQLDGNVRVIGIDVDADAIVRAKESITTPNATFFQENFRNLDKIILFIMHSRIHFRKVQRMHNYLF
jgi:16S rRNA (cytosine1402-N4)-methyltransferase